MSNLRKYSLATAQQQVGVRVSTFIGLTPPERPLELAVEQTLPGARSRQARTLAENSSGTTSLFRWNISVFKPRRAARIPV